MFDYVVARARDERIDANEIAYFYDYLFLFYLNNKTTSQFKLTRDQTGAFRFVMSRKE